MATKGSEKPRIPLSDPELLDYSGRHLHYELWMLFCSRGLMLNRNEAFKSAPSAQEGEDRRVELNAAVESFALHVRTLLLFLDPDWLHEDDVTARDFLPNAAVWSPPPRSQFQAARTQANKQVAHLTKLRIDGYHPDKEWDPDLAERLAAVLRDFAAKASPDKLHERFRALVLRVS